MSEITKKLIAIQKELKAPKGQMNTYGGYKYRSCEDILEAVKPLLDKHGCTLVLKDDIVQVGERYYIKATAVLMDTKEGQTVENTAFAREEESKKGMDASQITGTASSYARKYCLNGLFLIDDTKDADTDEYRKTTEKENAKKAPEKSEKTATPKQIELIMKIAAEQGAEISEEEVKSWTMDYASKVISSYTGGKKK